KDIGKWRVNQFSIGEWKRKGKDEPKDPAKKDKEEKDPGKDKEEPKKDKKKDPKDRPDVPDAPPSTKQVVTGEYMAPAGDAPSFLVQAQKDGGWRRLDLKNMEVWTGRPLVSLPGYRSDVKLKGDLRLTLIGMAPELWPHPPLLESAVVLHDNP